ncbi:MAG: glycosyltransferase family 2 protein [Candidatus Moranbacteria bacterium]|nr:glycosyltransferase family 2 protein [Bacteroidia bacterium]NCU31349.1 glycosyltransferase family 2 protein [Candidatus Moranbacteria bacterium]
MPRVSIVIRSRNDAPFIKRVLDKISEQTFSDYEILIFDNASTDGTREIIDQYDNIRSFSIPDGSYIPGKVLNLAFENCLGNIIVYNNSDSIPHDRFWLEELIKPLLNQQAQASYARQVSRPDAFPWVKLDYSRAFPDVPLSNTFFSMVSSATTRTTLERFPFNPNISYSEDIYWAKTLRDNGLKIAYTPKSIVEHSHNYSIEQVQKRFYGEGYADGQIWKKKQPFYPFTKGLLGGIFRDFFWLLKRNQIAHLAPCLKYRFKQKFSYRNGLKDYFKNI